MGKIVTLTIWTFVLKVMSLLAHFNLWAPPTPHQHTHTHTPASRSFWGPALPEPISLTQEWLSLTKTTN